MSERRYLRLQPMQQSDCSPAEAAAAIRELLEKVGQIFKLHCICSIFTFSHSLQGNNIAHDAALTLERSAEALEAQAAEEATIAPQPSEKGTEKKKKKKK